VGVAKLNDWYLIDAVHVQIDRLNSEFF